MTDIEKMFENAGFIKKQCKDYSCTVCKQYNNCEKYPPFTAEKQIEITKLIGSRYGLKFIVNEAMDYMLSTDLFNDDKFNIQGYGYGYDEAIANLTNNLWQDLDDKEKEEIRGILNE